MGLVRRAPGFWGWFYETTDEPWETDRLRKMLSYPNTRPLAELIRERQPDITICTHFLPAEIISHLIKRGRIDARLAIVVTDFHVHAMWLSRVFHRYFVPNEESKVHLVMLGMPEDRITVSGIPIHPAFGERPSRASLQEKHGLNPDLPIILMSAGTFGLTSAEEVVRALGFLNTPAQVVVVCGRNGELRKTVEDYVCTGAPEHLAFRVLGYTTEMHEWMTVADVFIGKPGGLTTSEALAKGLPMVVYQPIPGQEEYNSDYLLENGAALKCNDITTLAYKMDVLLSDKTRMGAMRDRAARLSHPEAAQTIIRTLLDDLHACPGEVGGSTAHAVSASDTFVRAKIRTAIRPLVDELSRWRRLHRQFPGEDADDTAKRENP
jgi:processive 1,2-diacylglycerol beta-glucosyltransferase